MGAPTLPPLIPQPFANNNPSLRNTIPNTTSTPGVASWDQGWPSDTMQPVVAGGVPPFGQDFNGVEFALSSHDYYVQAGQTFPFQAAVATAIGGYGAGAILGSATDPNVVWFNTANNNSTNPDATDGSAVGWVSLFAYGFATPPAQTGAAPLNLTNNQATRKFIVLTGTLTNNLTVNLPGGVLKDWLIINNTSGAFTTTIKTTASGSVGVAVPQGGFSNPLGVYSDGTNIYPTVAPLGIPISQGPSPLTLVERTNNGYVLATYFNQNSPSNENPGVGSIFVEQGGDGYLRKAALAYFESVLSLGAIGGQVSAGQVPLSAVIQYAANILSNAALTGVPTAPTAAQGTSNSQVATTAFASPSVTVNGNGICITLPNSYKLQMGTANPNGGGVTVTFPVPFTSSVFPVAISIAGGSVQTWLGAAPTLNNMSLHNTGGSSIWLAMGV